MQMETHSRFQNEMTTRCTGACSDLQSKVGQPYTTASNGLLDSCVIPSCSLSFFSFQTSLLQYLHRNLPTQMFNPIHLWLNYPHNPIAGPIKLYYLTQTAFYLHQVLILNAEARRKDHVQMMTHHVITIILVGMSYFYNFTRVGCLIMVLMDYCDIFLPASDTFSSPHRADSLTCRFVWTDC